MAILLEVKDLLDFMEKTNIIPRLWDIWLCVDSLLLKGGARFFKPKHNSEFREGDKTITVELSKATACMLNWKFCNNVEGRLNWVYISADEISFNSKIE
jgi:hypothetical protein